MNILTSLKTQSLERFVIFRYFFQSLILKAAFALGKLYWKTMPKGKDVIVPVLLSYDHHTASRRRLAAGKLATLLPFLIAESAPCVLNGVPSWLMDFATDSAPFVPPLDVVFPRQALIISLSQTSLLPFSSEKQPTAQSAFLEQGYSSPVLGDDRKLIEDLFARRLNLGPDQIPLIPIFCNAEDILASSSLDSLALVINRSWQSSIKWALSQLPALPDVSADLIESQVGTGNWVDRRIFLEEATFSALFPLGNDAKSKAP